MFNFSDMMGKIKEMQDQLQNVKGQMEDIIVEAESGGGMVRVKANANRKVLNIQIDPDIVNANEGDREIMEDLIVAAVNRALEQAEQKGREEMEKATKGMMPNLPGLDLGSIGFK